MQQITQIGEARLAYTTMINGQGDIKWIVRGEKGEQRPEIRLIEKYAPESKGYISLPVLDAKNRLKMTYFDWCDVYRQYFPSQALPNILQSIEEKRQQPNLYKPCPQKQPSLFDAL